MQNELQPTEPTQDVSTIIFHAVQDKDFETLQDLFQKDQLLILPISQKDELAKVITENKFLKSQLRLVGEAIEPLLDQLPELEKYTDKKNRFGLNLSKVMGEFTRHMATGKSNLLTILSSVRVESLKSLDIDAIKQIILDK